MKNTRQKDVWMGLFERLAVEQGVYLAGRIDWDTATHLFNQGYNAAAAVARLKHSWKVDELPLDNRSLPKGLQIDEAFKNCGYTPEAETYEKRQVYLDAVDQAAEFTLSARQAREKGQGVAVQVFNACTMSTRSVEERECVRQINENLKKASYQGPVTTSANQDSKNLLSTDHAGAEPPAKRPENRNPSDSTSLFFPHRTAIKYPRRAEHHGTQTNGPLSVQELEVSRNGYEGWDTFAVRTRENYCLAVVGQVDRATSEISRQAANLFAESPNLLKALEVLFPKDSRGITCLTTEEIEEIKQLIKRAKGEVTK